MVSYLRESLFRLCEMSINKQLSSDDLKEMYLKVLDTALAIVEKDKKEVESEKARAEATTEKAKAVNKLIDQGADMNAISPLLTQ